MKRIRGAPKCRRNAIGRHFVPTLGGDSHVLIRFSLFAILWIASALALANPYREHSDAELTDLAAGWESLSEDDRRALLTEMRSRMAAKKDGTRIIAIKTQRRYGRLVRQPDGSVVRIETTEQLVRYRRVPEVGDGAVSRPFGVGFEARTEPADPDAATQVNAPAPAADQP